jgi:hypothetical protein
MRGRRARNGISSEKQPLEKRYPVFHSPYYYYYITIKNRHEL